MSFRLRLNNISAPDFLRVTGVDQYILPSIDHYNSKIPGAYGNVDGGIAFGDKVFRVNYKMQIDSNRDDSYYILKLEEWLLNACNSTAKLTFDESGSYYIVRVTDATDYKDSILYGSGSITFTASNPRLYAPESTEVDISLDALTTVNYIGLVPAQPVFTIVCPVDTTSIKLTNIDTNEVITVSGSNLVGTVVIDCNKKFVSLDGTKDMTLLSLNSDWIQLKTGTNRITVVTTGADVTSITMEYTVTK